VVGENPTLLNYVVVVMAEETPVMKTELRVTATPVHIIFVTRKLICVFHVFFHAEFKCVIRIALTPTGFVQQNF
jgi:hypothetical protein